MGEASVFYDRHCKMSVWHNVRDLKLNFITYIGQNVGWKSNHVHWTNVAPPYILASNNITLHCDIFASQIASKVLLALLELLRNQSLNIIHFQGPKLNTIDWLNHFSLDSEDHSVQVFIRNLGHKQQGRVVRKPVNANPGLKVTRRTTFSCIKLFFTSHISCKLSLLKLKTEGHTI